MSESAVKINYELDEEEIKQDEQEEEEDEDWEFSFETADNTATTNSVVAPLHPEKEDQSSSTPLTPPPKPNRKPPSLPPVEGQTEVEESQQSEEELNNDEELPAPASTMKPPPIPTKPKPSALGGGAAKSVLVEEFKDQVEKYSTREEDDASSSPSTPTTPSASSPSVVRPPVPKRYAIEAESKSEIKTTVAKGKFEQSRDGFKAVDYSYVYTGDIVTISPHAEVKKKTVGVVRYVGTASGNDLIVGIECYEPQKGGCDGIYNGAKCFDVKYKGSGLFVKPLHVRKYEPVVEQLRGQNYEKIGYMIKMGRSNLKNWKKRWFILTLDYLHYFENPFSEKELGRVSVANCSVEPTTTDKPFCFVMKSSSEKELICSCETEQAKQDWMDTLVATGKIATERQSMQGALARAIMGGSMRKK